MQKAIVAWLNSAIETTNITIAKTKRQIDLIREYRTRLIADLVTGKLDVRDVVLPEMDGPPLENSDEEEEDTTDAENGHE